MKANHLIRVSLALGAGLCLLQVAHAYDPVRDGSYRRSCQNIDLYGNALYATCRTRDGDWRDTRLYNPYRCWGGIDNQDGRLVCKRGGFGGGGPWGAWLPQGSYTRSCRNVYMQGDNLHATCRERDGDWKRTVLRNVWACRSRIENENGNLRCRRW